MPTWLVPTLKWGGIGLAIIAAVAILYVRFIAATPAPEAGGSVRRGSHGTLLDSLRDRRRGGHRWVCSGGAKEAHLSAQSRSRRPDVQNPQEPVRVAPLRLALDDEGFTADGELIVRAWIADLARPHLEGRSLGMDARLAKADDRVGPPGDDPHRNRLATGRRVDGIDPERGERRIHRAREHRHQVRLPLISTRGRVQIGSGLDCTCSITHRTLLSDVLVACGVDGRGVDCGLRRLDRGRPNLAADGGGLVLDSAGLKQGPADLGDRCRLAAVLNAAAVVGHSRHGTVALRPQRFEAGLEFGYSGHLNALKPAARLPGMRRHSCLSPPYT